MFKSRADRFSGDFEKVIEIGRDAFDTEPIDVEPEHVTLPGESEAQDLMDRSRRLFDRMHADDREDAIGLHEKIGAAIESGDASALAEASRALREMLFFMEGKPN
jgi:hypothetical protein